MTWRTHCGTRAGLRGGRASNQLSDARPNPIGSTNIVVTSFRIIFTRIAVGAVAAFAVLCVGDSLSVRTRAVHPKPADPFESLKSLRILAIPEKNGKTEYEVDALNPEQTATCVHSVFPHYGYSPCWYVKPKINQPIPM